MSINYAVNLSQRTLTFGRHILFSYWGKALAAVAEIEREVHRGEKLTV